ncbi:LysR family substrate-binding domain-containing protein [Lacisediminihabitans sp.]|uniref:LysR family substrate-binding domain-containing protein n=1 Tax=Lacisediminihabitans sp. TaxID=2787631 RepID=UPI002F921AF9
MPSARGRSEGMTVNEDVAPFTIAFVAGVTLTRWTSAWADRQPGIPLAFLPVGTAEQTEVLHDGRADVSFVRFPVDGTDLSVIPLYAEVPVVVVPKDHPVSLFETVTLADLAEETITPPTLSPGDAVELVAAGGGVVILPQSIARMHGRKDVVARPVVDAPETRIAIAWVEANTTERVEEFVGIVRGRTAASSRATPTPPAEPKPPRKEAKPRPKQQSQAQARAAANRRRRSGR